MIKKLHGSWDPINALHLKRKEASPSSKKGEFEKKGGFTPPGKEASPSSSYAILFTKIPNWLSDLICAGTR